MRKLITVIRDMHNCEQTSGMSVYEHGVSVHKYYLDLINHLTTGDPLKFEWALPDWVHQHKMFLIMNQHSPKTMKFYQILHDCGKPKCLTTDERGNHFPNHAEVSAEVYGELPNADNFVQDLIRQDMQIHTMKATDVDEFCDQDIRTVCSLLLTSLAEVHSNSSMFGGTQNTSFKIKSKQIRKRGNAILNNLMKNV